MKKQSFQIGSLLVATAFGGPAALAQISRPDIAWLAGGQNQVVSLAYSPDGEILASGGHFDDTIKLWRASDGAMLRSLRTNVGNLFLFGPMAPVTFFPDGQTIIAFGEASGPAFWNVPDGNLFRKLNMLGSDLALNRGGSLIAIAQGVTSPSSLLLARVSDGAVVRSIPWPSDFVQRVAFSPNGTVVAAGDRVATLRTFRIVDGAPLWSMPAHASDILALSYSPDGTQIVTASYDHTAKLWNSATGELLATLKHANSVTSAAFSPDGVLLATGSSDGAVKLWTLPAPTLAGTLTQPNDVTALSFNPASTRLAVAAYNDIREYDLRSQTFVRNLVRATNKISGSIFTPDNTKLVSASYDGYISVADAATGALLRKIDTGTPSANIFSLAANGELAAAGINVPNVIKLYRLSDSTFLRTLDPGAQNYNRSAVFAPDGAILATGHHGNIVRVWDVVDGSLLRTLGPGGFSGDMNDVAYTSDGSLLLSASTDGFVRVWDGKGNLVRSIPVGGQQLSSVAISPDNQFVLAGGGSVLQLSRIDNGTLVYSFSAGGAINKARFTPSGFALYAALNDGTVRVYRTADHQLLETYSIEAGEGPGGISGVGKVLSLGFSPDGKRVAYGRTDATVVMAYNSLIAAPTSAAMVAGQIVRGSFQQLVMPDGMVLVAQPTQADQLGSAPLQLDIGAHSPLTNPTAFSFQVVVSVNVEGVQQEIWMRNAQTATLELVDARPIARSEQTIRIDLGPNFSRFIDASGNVVARMKWSAALGNETKGWEVSLDQAIWAAGL